MFQELLTREVGLLNALLGQLVHHLCLCGNAGMVGAGHPACVLTLHAGAANKNILNGVIEHVPHVEHTRYVGRRYHYGVRLTPIGLRTEQLMVQPILIPSRLHGLWIILTC